MSDTPSPEAIAEALRREWWYDNDRQALMLGSWPYGRRATADDWGALLAALEAERGAHAGAAPCIDCGLHPQVGGGPLCFPCCEANTTVVLDRLANAEAALEAERVAHAETLREAGELRAERTELLSGSIDRTMNELRRLLAEATAENEWLSVARSDLALAKQDLADALAALEAKDGELERLRVAWQRSLAMLRAAYPHPDHVPLVVERVIDMMAAALAPSTPKEGE